jgi:hypothetical protein
VKFAIAWLLGSIMTCIGSALKSDVVKPHLAIAWFAVQGGNRWRQTRRTYRCIRPKWKVGIQSDLDVTFAYPFR